MRSDTQKNMPSHMLKDEEVYITKFGNFMRKTSFDELPRLIVWAQVNGRDELGIKVKYDGEYMKKASFVFDLKIFFLTITKVFKHEGIVEGEHDENKPEKEKEKETIK